MHGPHVAVVVRRDHARSSKARGDHSAFLGASEEEAVEAALAAVEEWGPGRYEVVFGTLTSAAKRTHVYTVEPLGEVRPVPANYREVDF